MLMKSYRILILILVASLSLFIACQKHLDNQSQIPKPPDSDPEVTVTATIQGRVTDPDGNAVLGATVTSGNTTAQTDANGMFRFNGIQASKDFGFVKVSKTGFFTGSRTIMTSTAGSNYVQIELLKRESGAMVNSSGQIDINFADQCLMHVNNLKLINTANQAAYNGDAHVYETWIDPTDPKLASRMPGDLRGIDSTNKTVALKSYGMMAVEFEGTGGEKLQVAPGQQIGISMPIPATLLGAAPNTIPLWYFNDTTGKWIQQGYATKQGESYVGTVSHFTYWNCDYPSDIVYFHVNLKDQTNNPLAFTQLDVNNPDYNDTRSSFSDSTGLVQGWIPKNISLNFTVRSICGDPLFSQAEGPFATDQDLGIFNVTVSPLNALTVHGTVVNCANAPVANGFASITVDGLSYGANVVNGDFSATIIRCSTAPGQVGLIVGDLTANVRSTSASFPISGSDLNTGQSQACGAALDQYINFSISGTSYSVTVPPDSISTQGAPTYTYINGFSGDFGTSNYKAANFNVPIASVGTSTMAYLTFTIGNSWYFEKADDPINCSITQFDGPGGYVIGSFTGNVYKDSTGAALPLIGSFKVKEP